MEAKNTGACVPDAMQPHQAPVSCAGVRQLCPLDIAQGWAEICLIVTLCPLHGMAAG